MKRLIKSKIFWIASVYLCLTIVALTFAINTDKQSEHYECTLEDILSSDKVEDVYYAMVSNNLSLTDEIKLAIYFETKPNEDEILHIEELGVNIYSSSWVPPVGPHPYGLYLADCKIEDICKLIDFESAVRIRWSGSISELLNETQ
jgi:hypothetical protein